MANMTVTNAVILPMTQERRSFTGYVKTRDGVIAEVGEGTGQVTTDDQVVDASGCVLMPGFINAHTHLYQV